MKIPLLLTFLLLFFQNCLLYGQSNNKSTNTEESRKHKLKIAKKFVKAYQKKDTTKLKKILNHWHKSINPCTEESIYQNDTIRAIFEIYQAFYQPFDLFKLGEWEWGNRLNSHCKYAVIQDKIYYVVVDPDDPQEFDWKKVKRDSIVDFRPPLNFEMHKTLYITSDYKNALNKFLGTKSTKVGEGNIMNPSYVREESRKRHRFIRSYLPILHGHWGGYWHIETHPEISTVLIDKTLTAARVYFRVGYQGGEAIMGKKPDGWKITWGWATWIE